MTSSSQRQKNRDRVRSKLDTAIQSVNLARDACGIAPAEVAFGSVSNLLVSTEVCFLSFCDDELRFTFIQVSMVNKLDYVDILLSCADVCKTLDRGLEGRQLGELDKSVLRAIEQL